MSDKRLLIVDADAKAWENSRLALGDSWEVVGANTCAAALAEAEKQPFTAVLANYDLPEPGAPELLNRLRTANPKTVRIIAADPTLKEKVMGQVLGGDQFLPLPLDFKALKTMVERAPQEDYGMGKGIRELVGKIRTFPTIPSLYLEMTKTLKDPNATTEDIGALIVKDMSMTTKLVQVLNSAYFGMPRNITDPTEAVGILGFETVKSLVLAVKLLSQYDNVKPVYFSIDQIWRHSTHVARTARVMALVQTDNVGVSSLAYTGGLMHDLGKVILAANFDEQYHGAHNIARKQHLPLWEVEKDFFGATHGEIGAYLLSLWGLPSEVVKTAAMHHHPMRSGDKHFTPLTAVHVANALEYENETESDGLPIPVVDADYLEQLGMADRMELWRFARREPDAVKHDTKFYRKKGMAKPAEKQAEPAPTSPPAAIEEEVHAHAETPSRFPGYLIWLGVGAAAVVCIVLGIFLASHKGSQLAVSPVVQATKGTEVTQAPVPAVTEVVKPVPAPVVAAAPVPRAAAPVQPAAPPRNTAFDNIRLQAIFYSAHHPTALINGGVAEVNENVGPCRVVQIAPTSVTLQSGKEQKTIYLQ